MRKSTTTPAAEDVYVRTPQAADRCKVSSSLLNKLRSSGDGPPYAKFGGIVLYRITDLDAWIDSHKCTSTSGSR